MTIDRTPGIASSISSRLNPPIWRHDAYTLRKLQSAVESALRRLHREGSLSPARSVVVDFGAGEAPYRTLFAPYASKYIACDLEQTPTTDLTFDPGAQIPLATETADCVVSFQVLEHVWDLDAYFSECARLLQPNGRLILSTHGTWLYHPHPIDYRRWTRDGLLRELTERGFDVLALYPIVGPLAWTTQFRTFAYCHVLGRFGWPGAVLAKAISTLMFLRMTLEDKLTPKHLIEQNASTYLVIAGKRNACPAA